MGENGTTNHEADVSSGCPSTEGVEELWVACDLCREQRSCEALVKNANIKTKLVQREAFIYALRIKGVGYKDFTALFVLLGRERMQIVMLWLGWFARLKWYETCLEAYLSSFRISRRCS